MRAVALRRRHSRMHSEAGRSVRRGRDGVRSMNRFCDLIDFTFCISLALLVWLRPSGGMGN